MSDGSKIIPTLFKLVLGLVFLGVGIWAVIGWFESLKIVFQGCIGIFFILMGVIILIIAKE